MENNGAPSNGSVPTLPVSATRRKLRRLVWQWERKIIWPMFILSFTFSTLGITWLFYRSALPADARAAIETAMTTLWIIFILDFLLRWWVSVSRVQFVRERWFEMASLLIPFLRPLIPLAYAWRLPVFFDDTAKGFRIRYQITTATIAMFFLYLISLLVWKAEEGVPGATIKNWGDSLWWGISTITTVGYGDITPVTLTGRILATVLMVVGVFIFGVVSASFINTLSAYLQKMSTKHTRKMQLGWQEAEGVSAQTTRSSADDWRHAYTGRLHKKPVSEAKLANLEIAPPSEEKTTPPKKTTPPEKVVPSDLQTSSSTDGESAAPGTASAPN